MNTKIEKATPNDLDLLNQLLYSSKAHWGYDEKFMGLFMQKLNVTKSYLENNQVKILYIDNTPAGFFSFSINADDDLELDNFFLLPKFIGKGLGKKLWEACCNTAKEYNKKFFILWSDPNAEPFYLKMGCKKIGERPSPMMPNRNPPILKYVLYNDEIKLSDGVNTVVKIGNTVCRIPGEWTDSVHELLKHLRKHGFFSAPEVLGFDEKGREILSFIEGEAGTYTLTPAARSNSALISAAKLLRAYHDVTSDFAHSYHGNWQLQSHPPIEVICHGDYAPYNCVYKEDKVIGILDFDMAHPGSRIWDIAYAVYRFAPITSPENQEGFGTPEEQVARAKLFCDAYELQERQLLISTMIERITALLAFLYAKANSGNKIYQRFVAEGHDEIYLTDLDYIKNNEKFLTKSILK